MTDQTDLDRRLVSWLDANGPGPVSQQVVRDALIHARSRPQRRTGAGGRSRPGSLILALGLLIALSVIAAVMVGNQPSPVPTGVSNGWIAYATEPGHGGDNHTPTSSIYLVREGAEPRLLAGDPVWARSAQATYPSAPYQVRDSDPEAARYVCPDFSTDGILLAYGEGLGIDTAGQPLDRVRRAIVIVSVDSDGLMTGTPIRLPVAGAGRAPCPAWSPDGSQLAYRDGDGLVLMRLDGTSTVIPGWDEGLPSVWLGEIAWSPDGTTIAAARPSGTWLVPMDGAAPHLLRSGESRNLSWSPEGTYIAVDGDNARLLPVSGQGAEVDLGEGTNRPLWSPAGDRVAYGTDGGVGVSRPDGSDTRVLDIGGPAAYDLVAWSPDGLQLLEMVDTSGVGWDMVSTPVPPATDAISQPSSLTVVRDVRHRGYYWPGRGDVSWQVVHR